MKIADKCPKCNSLIFTSSTIAKNTKEYSCIYCGYVFYIDLKTTEQLNIVGALKTGRRPKFFSEPIVHDKYDVITQEEITMPALPKNTYTFQKPFTRIRVRHTPVTDVKDFMIAGNQVLPSKPVIPDAQIVNLRINLILEEAQEFEVACNNITNREAPNDLIAVADALADLHYVTYGAALAFGIDIRSIFTIVHESNMQKFSELRVQYNKDGKVLKPDDWESPTEQIYRELKKQAGEA